MDQEITIKITNNKQFECLVQLMEKNLEIAKGYYSFGSSKQEFNNSWSIFAEKINSLGPPITEGAGWQKVWTDFKGKIKKKLSNNKKEIAAIGGGPCRLQILSPKKESVSRLLFFDKMFDKPNTSFGLNHSSIDDLPTTTSQEIQNEIEALQEDVQIECRTEEVAVLLYKNEKDKVQPLQNANVFLRHKQSVWQKLRKIQNNVLGMPEKTTI